MTISIDLQTKVKEVMMDAPICVSPNTLMTEVEQIFSKNTFHHIPVLNEEKQAVGIISKSDFYKLQHHFTLFGYKDAKESNERFFKSLIASDIMNKKPITIGSSTPIGEAIKMFLVNRFHSLIVTEETKCVGIITPHDFLELLTEE
jgi:CBS domain-containing protein